MIIGMFVGICVLFLALIFWPGNSLRPLRQSLGIIQNKTPTLNSTNEYIQKIVFLSVGFKQKASTDEKLKAIENDLFEMDYNTALTRLSNYLTESQSDEEKARIYNDLGNLEMTWEHYEFACLYFEDRYNLVDFAPEPTYSVAFACYYARDLKKALQYYQFLEYFRGEDATEYQEEAQIAITNIQRMLSITPTPEY